MSDRTPRPNTFWQFFVGKILFIAFSSLLCGVRTYELMEEFGELREDWLRQWLALPNGLPSYNTFSRVFQAIAPSAFAGCIAAHLGRLGFEMDGLGHSL